MCKWLLIILSSAAEISALDRLKTFFSTSRILEKFWKRRFLQRKRNSRTFPYSSFEHQSKDEINSVTGWCCSRRTFTHRHGKRIWLFHHVPLSSVVVDVDDFDIWSINGSSQTFSRDLHCRFASSGFVIHEQFTYSGTRRFAVSLASSILFDRQQEQQQLCEARRELTDRLHFISWSNER